MVNREYYYIIYNIFGTEVLRLCDIKQILGFDKALANVIDTDIIREG